MMRRTIRRDGWAVLLGTVALCLCHAPRVDAMEFLGQAGVLGEMGIDRQSHRKRAGAGQAVFRSAQDEARRDLHAGRAGRTRRRDPPAIRGLRSPR